MPVVLLGVFLILVAAMCGLSRWRVLPTAFRIMTIQCIVAFLFEMGGVYLGLVLGRSNQWLLNIYLILEIWLIGFVAYNLLSEYRRAVTVALVLLTALWGYFIWNSGIAIFANKLMIAEGLVFLAMFLLVLFKTTVKKEPFFSLPETWLSISILIFFAGTLPIMGMVNYLNTVSPNQASTLYYITNIVCIMRYGLAAFSFLLFGRKKKEAFNVSPL
jgi:hypothetical protein